MILGGNEISKLGNIKIKMSKHQMVKDKPYEYGAASSMGTQKKYFKILKSNKIQNKCVGRMGHKVCPPPHQRTKIFLKIFKVFKIIKFLCLTHIGF